MNTNFDKWKSTMSLGYAMSMIQKSCSMCPLLHNKTCEGYSKLRRSNIIARIAENICNDRLASYFKQEAK